MTQLQRCHTDVTENVFETIMFGIFLKLIIDTKMQTHESQRALSRLHTRKCTAKPITDCWKYTRKNWKKLGGNEVEEESLTRVRTTLMSSLTVGRQVKNRVKSLKCCKKNQNNNNKNSKTYQPRTLAIEISFLLGYIMRTCLKKWKAKIEAESDLDHKS